MTVTESKEENELDAMLANRERAEEAIGPVADLSAFSDFAQALHTGNDRRYGVRKQACSRVTLPRRCEHGTKEIGDGHE